MNRILTIYIKRGYRKIKTEPQVFNAMPYGTKNAYFVVWTRHEMGIGNTTFDKELQVSIKSKFEMFSKDFYLNLFFSE